MGVFMAKQIGSYQEQAENTAFKDGVFWVCCCFVGFLNAGCLEEKSKGSARKKNQSLK